jgi:Ca-activated chloride channel homolog
MEFRTPLLLLLIPILWLALILARARRKETSFTFSSLGLFNGLTGTWRTRFREIPFVLRLIVVMLFIIALAGPRRPLEESVSTAEGIDIVLLLDASTSMAAEDFTINGQRTNRLQVVKNVVRDFISKRVHDRVGLVVFAARPYVACPLTTDHSWLEANLDRVDFGLIEDGTAIGSAIASGANRLRDVKAKSKIMVLLTDGINNAGKIDPMAAAGAAKALGVRVYTIGAGSRGPVPYPTVNLFGQRAYQNVQIDIDEDTLKKIAESTGGQYFRATDTESLKAIYDQIDKLEKVKIEEQGYRQYEEYFDKVLLAALLVLILEVVLGKTVFLKIP